MAIGAQASFLTSGLVRRAILLAYCVAQAAARRARGGTHDTTNRDAGHPPAVGRMRIDEETDDPHVRRAPREAVTYGWVEIHSGELVFPLLRAGERRPARLPLGTATPATPPSWRSRCSPTRSAPPAPQASGDGVHRGHRRPPPTRRTSASRSGRSTAGCAGRRPRTLTPDELVEHLGAIADRRPRRGGRRACAGCSTAAGTRRRSVSEPRAAAPSGAVALLELLAAAAPARARCARRSRPRRGGAAGRPAGAAGLRSSTA